MQLSHLSARLALLAFTSAAPTLDRREALSGDSDNSNSKFPTLLDFVKRIPSAITNAPSTCDLAQAQMPVAPSPLPPPTVGLKPYHIAIGRGRQNYTCDTTNSTAVPVARGAVATLFNVTCIASDTPALSNSLPDIAVNLPDPSTQSRVQRSALLSRDISGHHFFSDDTTPVFHLTTPFHDYGVGSFKKNAATPAPKDAMAGQYGQGDGAAPWLKLEPKDPKSDQVLREVYRVNTAGGNAPKSCQGMPASFQVQYSAEYWFFA